MLGLGDTLCVLCLGDVRGESLGDACWPWVLVLEGGYDDDFRCISYSVVQPQVDEQISAV